MSQDAARWGDRMGGIPARIGPYVLDAPLGYGRYGAVYRGRYIARNWPVPVAVRLVEPALAPDAATRAQVVRVVVRLASRLDHPHLGAVYDVGEVHETVYIVQSLIIGPTLRDVLYDEPVLSLSRAVMVIEQVGTALAALHAVGVVWADPNPLGHVILSNRAPADPATWAMLRNPWLRHVLTTSRREHGGVGIPPMPAGTPVFGALDPSADLSSPAPQTDVYQLGAIAWALLTGGPPANDGTMGTLQRATLDGQPPEVLRAHLQAIRPEVLPEVAEVISTALAPDPARRQASAEEFSRQFRAATGPVRGMGSNPEPEVEPRARPRLPPG